jgi:hypothetical protein
VEKEGSSSSGVDAEQSGVRHRQLLQNGKCVRENKRGKCGEGGGSTRCRVEEGKQEREGPGRDGRQRGPRARMAPSSTIRGDSTRSRRRRASEQGRAAGRRRHSAAWLTCRAVRQRGPVVSDGVQEEERKVRQRGSRAPIGGPGPHNAVARFKLGFKPIQKYSNGSNEI